VATTQSEKIRTMAKKGRTNSQIAKALGIRYQTVWRTLHRPYKGVVPQVELVALGIRESEPAPILDAEDTEEQELVEETVEETVS